MAVPRQRHVRYTTLTGFFQQDDAATDAFTFDYSTSNFGLIDRAYDTDSKCDPERRKTQWERFDYLIRELNRTSATNVQFKVLYLSRHGEGYHNAAEASYGSTAWNEHWSKLEGNDSVIWADAKLTAPGRVQALNANQFWRTAIAEQKISLPDKYYCSPLARCLETARLTFSGLNLPPNKPFAPIVKELFREHMGEHTCDRRSTKTWIHQNFPEYVLEEGFHEDDPLYTHVRELDDQIVNRIRLVLDDVFLHDKSTYISISAHGGVIRASLEVLGHRPFHPETGQSIPVLVSAETFEDVHPKLLEDLYVSMPAYLASLPEAKSGLSACS